MKRFTAVAVVFALVLSALLSGCASRGHEAAPTGSAVAASENVFVFRHKVRLSIPGMDLPGGFEGVMRLFPDGPEPAVRVIGLGGIGLTLFDMEITPDMARAAYIHPSLRKTPHIEQHIADCIRSVWFDCLLPARRNGGAPVQDDGPPHPGGLESCSAEFSPERPWPARTVFRHTAPDYTVDIRLLGVRTTEREKNP